MSKVHHIFYPFIGIYTLYNNAQLISLTTQNIQNTFCHEMNIAELLHNSTKTIRQL